MSPHSQRIALAELAGLVTGASLGYTDSESVELYRSDQNGTWHDLATWTKKYEWVQSYDPLSDLNAVAEVENSLDASTFDRYTENLSVVCNCVRKTDPDRHWRWMKSDVALVVNATAAQRSEAILRTVGKWTED